MTDMVERVAQAIRDNIQAALPDGVSVDYRYAARAAIEAMREPTGLMEFMMDSWFNFMPHGGEGKRRYQGLIDAALKENEEKT